MAASPARCRAAKNALRFARPLKTTQFDDIYRFNSWKAIMLSLATLVLGLAMLVVGGGLLVRGASAIATEFGVSSLIVGLTVVGFGTSAPELVVNIIGASQGATGLAFGNVVGSNISNLALVLGAAAVMMPIAIQGQLVRREVPLLLLITTIMTVMSLDGFIEGQAPVFGRIDAVVLLLLFLIFLYTNVLDLFQAKRKDALIADIEESQLAGSEQVSRFRWLMVLAGITLLFFGGDLTVNSGVSLASALGVPATIVGLFVVAVGTSMPELVTSVIAAMRNESDLALGNVVGSNLFNSLMVLPVSGLIRPIPIPQGGIVDLAVSWGLVAILIPVFFIGKARLGRGTGVMLIAGYVVYLVYRVVTSAG
jgi:cation:H+ antiporter